MNKKTLVACLIALAVMATGIGVAVYFLYHNVGVSSTVTEEVSDEEYDLTFPGAGESAKVTAEVTSMEAPATEKAEEPRKEEKVSEKRRRQEKEETEAVQASVAIPSGPFDVKNCKTGRMNQFVQTADHALVLKDRGKALWITSFHAPLCGRVGTLDYYANGKLQFAFCAGTKLYVIDRLGRFVKTFPKDLGKDILLGPDLYDFNGQRIYNVLVLHKDNTVEMYNMKGQKPASWKGITSRDTILDLPENINVGGKTFWVVRTAAQTLIFPFYGGKPIDTGHRIARDSKIKVLDSTSVEVQSDEGKKLTLKLR